jgi:hypothetical protein
MYLDPTKVTGRRFLERRIKGPVTMLNLLGFRDEANYSASPELAPPDPITGRVAYAVYEAHTLPFLDAAGGRATYVGEGGHFMIGPATKGGTW